MATSYFCGSRLSIWLHQNPRFLIDLPDKFSRPFWFYQFSNWVLRRNGKPTKVRSILQENAANPLHPSKHQCARWGRWGIAPPNECTVGIWVKSVSPCWSCVSSHKQQWCAPVPPGMECRPNGWRSIRAGPRRHWLRSKPNPPLNTNTLKIMVEPWHMHLGARIMNKASSGGVHSW